ncbi:MAG: hypothetical protein ACREOO_29405 [bacterium]
MALQSAIFVCPSLLFQHLQPSAGIIKGMEITGCLDIFDQIYSPGNSIIPQLLLGEKYESQP